MPRKEVAPSSTSDWSDEVKTNANSLQMRVVDPLREAHWDHVAALHRDASCFHTTAWAKVLHQTYNHRPFYLQFSRGSRLALMIPLMEVRSPITGRRGVCLPFSDACEPLIFSPEVMSRVTDQILLFARERGWRHLEIRGGKSLRLGTRPAAKFYGHNLRLSGSAEELIARFHGAVRRAIRKAERSGVDAVVAHDRQAIRDFYRLHVQTRRRHGLPPQTASFFHNVYEHIIKSGFGFTVVAQRGSRPIAAAIFFRFRKNAFYKYGASDKRFQEFRANNLVMWRGIQFLARSGAEKLSFGRTDWENEGLRRFKLSWNTQEETIEYFRVDPSSRQCLTPPRHGSGFHGAIFGRLPLLVNRLAGSIIYPHLD
jgi:Acetyltransferase (GNAT) domain